MNLKAALITEFTKRFGQIENCFLLASSTFLDPRFKNIHFKDPLACANMIQSLRSEIAANLLSSGDESTDTDSEIAGASEIRFDLWAHHKELAHSTSRRSSYRSGNRQNDEVSQYINMPVSSLNQDCFIIWDEMKKVYPGLYALAEKYLRTVATSVPCERLFSKAGATATKTRNRLTGKMLSKLLFLNSLSEEYWH